MTHIEFINDWNASEHQPRVALRAVTQGDRLFGVEVRFCGREFRTDAEIFNTLCNRIFSVSKGSVQVTSSEGDFRSGILYIAVLFFNHGYQPEYITETLKFITDEILPDLKIE